MSNAVGFVLAARAREHAEKTRLGIDRPQPAIGPRTNPCDVVADRPRLPAGHRCRRHEHRHVGLSARRRKRAGDVPHGPVLVAAADDQHVLGEPAFVARLIAREAKREAFLAEQRVAAVAGSDRPHRVLFRKMDDEAAIGAEIAQRVQALREVVGFAEMIERRRSDARHDAHVQHDVSAVGDFHADLGVRRSGRAHQERHHEHRAPLHRSAEQRQSASRARRRAPSSCSSARHPPSPSC